MQVSLTKQVRDAKKNQATDCAPKPSLKINSFKFRETCAIEWQHLDVRCHLSASMHIKAACNAIMQSHTV